MGENMTDKTRIDEGKVDRLALAFSKLAFRGCCGDDAGSESAGVGDISEESYVYMRVARIEMGVCSRLHRERRSRRRRRLWSTNCLR